MRRFSVLLVLVLALGCSSEKGGGPAISTEEWKTQVLQSREPVVVDFTAPWCGPCQKMNPVIEALAKNYKVKKVDFDTNPDLRKRYEITSIPAILIFKDGEVVVRHEGYTPESTLRKDLEDIRKQ